MSGWRTAKRIIDQFGEADRDVWNRVHQVVRLLGEQRALRLAEQISSMAERGRRGPTETFLALAREATGEAALRYPWDADYCWFAADAVGHIAAFFTGGEGPIPLTVLERKEVADEAIDRMWDLPLRGDYLVIVKRQALGDAIHFGQRGLFCYDWRDVHRTSGFRRQYEGDVQPRLPISIGEVGGELSSLLGATTFVGLRFADSPRIDPKQSLSCVPDV
jgi:hypothetical protein